MMVLPPLQQRRVGFVRILLLIISLAVKAEASGWVATGSMVTSRTRHAAILLSNGKVLAVGGNSTSALATAELYDPATGLWSPTGSMSTARDYFAAVLLPNGKVLAAGGNPGGDSAELYDPTSGFWSPTGSLTTRRTYPTATLLANGQVLFVGGGDATSAEVYDPSLGVFASTGAMAHARIGFTATLLPNGKVLVSGGDVNGTSEVYDPGTGNWSLPRTMLRVRSNHTATLMTNGKVLVAGGDTGLASAEVYDPAGDTWSATPPMVTIRSNAAAALLPNGDILIAGGTDGSHILSSVEIYDPTSGVWTAGPNMLAPLMDETATLLFNQFLLVAGAAPSSEIFFPSGLAILNAPGPSVSVDGNYVFVSASAFSESPISNVRFQYKLSAASNWNDMIPVGPHPNPAVSLPYLIHWDVTALTEGSYDVRAVVTNGSGPETSPKSATIIINHSNPDLKETNIAGTIETNLRISSSAETFVSIADEAGTIRGSIEIHPHSVDVSTKTISLTLNPPNSPPPPVGASHVGPVLAVSLSGGQTVLLNNETAGVSLFLGDQLSDLLIGTGLRPDQVRMYSANSVAGPWTQVATTLSLDQKSLSGITSHFSFFALFSVAAADLSQARIFPNPFMPHSGNPDTGTDSTGISFDKLAVNATIKIFTVAGQLVARISSTLGGVAHWDATNENGRPVASGGYLAEISAPGNPTIVRKILVVR